MTLTLCAFVAAACDSSDAGLAVTDTMSDTPPRIEATPRAEDFAATVADVQARAQELGASEQQLAAINDIAAQGAVTSEQARTAALNTVDCITEAGGSAEYTESTGVDGFPLPGFVSTVGGKKEAQALEMSDTCDYQESYWINYLYQSQPEFGAAQAIADELRLAARIACLRDKGVPVDDHATWVEVSTLIHDLPESQSFECATAGA